MAKSKTRTTRTMCLIQQPTIGKTLCLLLIATVLPLLSACQTTQTDEPKWNDMYEVRSYEVHTETYTNEIITTVFISKFTETNKVIATQKEVEDFGGYEFEPIEQAEEPVVKQNLTTPEFQCVDGSCGLGGDINVPSK